MKQVDFVILQVWLKISCFIVKLHPNETRAVQTEVFADVPLCLPCRYWLSRVITVQITVISM